MSVHGEKRESEDLLCMDLTVSVRQGGFNAVFEKRLYAAGTDGCGN